MGLLDPEYWRLVNERMEGLLGQPVTGVNQFAGLLSGTITPKEFAKTRLQQLEQQTRPTPENAANFMGGGLVGSVKSAKGLIPEVIDVSYRGSHSAPTKGRGAPSHDLTQDIYPDDIYSPMAAQYYGHFGQNHPMDVATVRALQSLRGKPDAEITVYRAVPKGQSGAINPGDWVTPSRQYAKQHGESALNGEYEIVAKKVRAKEIYTDGNSIHEFGYDPNP